MQLLVDGMNVIGSRPDGWWRDRDGAARAFVERLQGLASRRGEEIIVVFDGRPTEELPPGEHDGVLVLYAERPGRDAADDRIVTLVASAERPGELRVITSDRGLRQRVGVLGAAVAGATELLERLDALDL